MPTKQATAEIERAPEPAPDISGQPRLVIAGGRGKTGKSVTLRACIEHCLARGDEPVIADGDRTNPTLKAFFPHALTPPSAENDDVRDWLMTLVDTQIERRTTAYLDLGGGDQMLKQWCRELDLADFLVRYGITPVLLHVLGTDIDDLTYMRDLETVFAPKHTAIILNAGMVPSGKSALTAFEPVISHPIFKAARDRGAVVVMLPRLGCMQDVDKRRLSFADAEAGKVKPGQDKIGPTMQQMVSLWRREVPVALKDIMPWIT